MSEPDGSRDMLARDGCIGLPLIRFQKRPGSKDDPAPIGNSVLRPFVAEHTVFVLVHFTLGFADVAFNVASMLMW